MSTWKNVDKVTKGRSEKTLKLYTRDLEKNVQWDCIFYDSILCPIRRLLCMFNIISSRRFFTIRHYIPFARLLYSTLFPVDKFVIFDILSHSAFITSFLCPVIIIYHSTLFLLFNVFSVDLFSQSTFFLSMIFTVGFFYFDVLSVDVFFTIGVFYFDVLSDVLWYVLHYVPPSFPATKVEVAGVFTQKKSVRVCVCVCGPCCRSISSLFLVRSHKLKKKHVLLPRRLDKIWNNFASASLL
jgi:hypothetical protein